MLTTVNDNGDVTCISTLKCTKDFQEYLNQLGYKAAKRYLSPIRTLIKQYKKESSLTDCIKLWEPIVAAGSATNKLAFEKFKDFLSGRNLEKLRTVYDTPLAELIEKFITVRPGIKSDRTVELYQTILLEYASFVDFNLREVKQNTARNFIKKEAGIDSKHSKTKRTVKLYKSVLSSFAKWALSILKDSSEGLKEDERKIWSHCENIGRFNLKEIRSISVPPPDDSSIDRAPLTSDQRDDLLERCVSLKDKFIIALMAWNGLRTGEILRLQLKDLKSTEGKINVWGKGDSGNPKIPVYFMKEVRRHFNQYLTTINHGPEDLVFPNTTELEIAKMVCDHLVAMGLRGGDSDKKFTAESLRNTAGQLMYNQGIAIEFIHHTLRNKSIQSTLKFAKHNFKERYFQEMEGL